LGKSIFSLLNLKNNFDNIIEKISNKCNFIGELKATNNAGINFNVRVSATTIKNEINDINIIYSFTDISVLKIGEKEILKTKGYLQNVINSSSEIIVAIDDNHKITSWNKTVENITDYKKREVIGSNITNMKLFVNSQELIESINNICDGTKTEFNELILRVKDGSKRIISGSFFSNKIDDEKPKEVLFIGKDITRNRNLYGKFFQGNSYLITNRNNSFLLDLFENLINEGYEGLFITRNNPETLKLKMHSEKLQILSMDHIKSNKFENIIDLNDLITKIEEFIKHKNKTVISLNRIDYLLIRFSFEEFINCLYKINSIVRKNNSILLLHINPSIIDERQFAIIKEELQFLPNEQIGDLQIDDKLFSILKFLYEQNQNCSIVTFKKINKEFSIVKSTTAKRLKILEDNGLVLINKQGRSKIVNLSNKGIKFLHKRQLI
jgi:PAS domain S-box-containing protein